MLSIVWLPLPAHPTTATMRLPLSNLTNNSIDLHFCNHSWCPKDVFVTGAGTKEAMLGSTDDPANHQYNLMDIFCCEQQPLRSPALDFPSVYFSPKMYPPTREGFEKISETITDAFYRQANTSLVKGRRPCKREPNKATGEVLFTLECTKGRPEDSRNKSGDNNRGFDDVMRPDGECISYKKGVRLNWMINDRNKGTRHSESKHGGKRMGNRTKTGKADNLCNFKINLYLKENEYWRIPFRSKQDRFHNHVRRMKDEMPVRTNALSKQEQQIGGIAMKHAGSGGAVDIMSEITGFTLSKQQTTHLRDLHEEIPTTKSTDSCNQAVEHLRALAKQGKVRYKALYHIVNESSLFAAKVAREVDRLERQRKRQKTKQGIDVVCGGSDGDGVASASNGADDGKY